MDNSNGSLLLPVQKAKNIIYGRGYKLLDEKNKRKINEAISKLAITRGLVAHRKSTVESIDRNVNL